MLLKKQKKINDSNIEKLKFSNSLPLFFQAFLVGNLTGLLGVGGGFLIVPVLIIFQGFNIKQAAESSMYLIFLNSWFAIIVDLSNNFFNLNYQLFLFIIIFSVIGLIIGKNIQKKINIKMMQKIFAIFLIIISLFLTYNTQFFL